MNKEIAVMLAVLSLIGTALLGRLSLRPALAAQGKTIQLQALTIRQMQTNNALWRKAYYESKHATP